MLTKNGPLRILDQSLEISNNQLNGGSSNQSSFRGDPKRKVPRILGMKSPGRMGIVIESSALPMSRLPP